MKYKLFGLSIGLLLSVFFLSAVQAQVGIQKAGGNLNIVAKQGAGITEDNIGNVVGTVINAVLSLVGLIFLILMVYAGFLWMTAQGDEGKVDKAKDIIRASITGLVITVSAYAITYFVTSKFEGTGSGGGIGDGTTNTGAAGAGAGAGNPAGTSAYCLNTASDGSKICEPSTGSSCTNSMTYSSLEDCVEAL